MTTLHDAIRTALIDAACDLLDGSLNPTGEYTRGMVEVIASATIGGSDDYDSARANVEARIADGADTLGTHGRCDTCGAAMNEWVCPVDETHEVCLSGSVTEPVAVLACDCGGEYDSIEEAVAHISKGGRLVDVGATFKIKARS